MNMTKEEISKINCIVSAPVDPNSIWRETHRLILRPLSLEDLQDIHEISSQEEVAQMSGWQCCETPEMSEKRLKHDIEDRETVAVVLKENCKVIGTISLQKRPWHLYPIDRSLKGREFGFDLNKDYWGRGLMPEAVQELMDYCFETWGYDFLIAGHFQDNIQSKRAIEKCGFQFLFEDDRELPSGKVYHIYTYIKYNPRKEIKHV
jgi:ribosomal-protein-alanine N-acetyltransferase